MDEVRIKALERKEVGTSQARGLRSNEYIPAVVYGKGFNRLVKIEEKNLKYLKQHHFSENVIITLEVEKDGKVEKIPTLLKDYQIHAVRENILHLDFVKVSMKKRVQVEVPVETTGDAKGVKEGGALEHVLWHVQVECLPMDIPEKIVLDISGLGINQSLHVSDIKIEGNFKILNEPEDVVLAIVPPAKVEEPEQEVSEEAEEPEVLKEKTAKEETEDAKQQSEEAKPKEQAKAEEKKEA
jgi:large subunit ribosomal protein L25